MGAPTTPPKPEPSRARVRAPIFCPTRPLLPSLMPFLQIEPTPRHTCAMPCLEPRRARLTVVACGALVVRACVSSIHPRPYRPLPVTTTCITPALAEAPMSSQSWSSLEAVVARARCLTKRHARHLGVRQRPPRLIVAHLHRRRRRGDPSRLPLPSPYPASHCRALRRARRTTQQPDAPASSTPNVYVPSSP
jgi:hypothetical protein